MNSNNNKQVAISFIKRNFIKCENKICSYSSYALKHILQYSTNVYMKESDFVNLMGELGYKKSPRGKWKMWFSPEIVKYIKEGGLLC